MTKPHMTPPPSATPISITLDKATVSYGADIVLDQVSITIAKPEITVILGHNGAGKSTFLSAVAGLLPLTAGTHHRLDSAGQPAPITKVGYVLQKPVMFRRSVLENINMALAAAGFHGPSHYPTRDAVLAQFGIDHLIDKPVSALSQGERQRLAVARVLLMQPGILMFDEATNSLDQDTITILEEQTRRYADAGLPVLWVTHSLAQAERLADRVVVIDQGRITKDAKAQDFFKQA